MEQEIKQDVTQIEEQGSTFDHESMTSLSVKTNGLHDQLEDIADSFNVDGFKCVKCNLVHGHDTTKHQLSGSFDIDETDSATELEYNPVCHCGVHEAARHGSDVGIDEDAASSVAGDAPIPPETSREMDSELGAL